MREVTFLTSVSHDNSRASILALLIDVPFYAEQDGVSCASESECIEHYLNVGWLSDLDPSPWFSTARYLDLNPALREQRINPYLHYLFVVVGEDALERAFAGLGTAHIAKLRAYFDQDWYSQSNPDITLTVNDPFIHYLTQGWQEMRDPSPIFSTSAYLDLHPDVRNSGIMPFRHWVLHGIEEGRATGRNSASTLDSSDSLSAVQQMILDRMFSLDYYRPRSGEDGVDLAKRVSSGWSEAGSVTPSFLVAKYVASHPEVRGTNQVPFLHYLFVVVGEDSLRDLFVAPPLAALQSVCDSFDTAWYLSSYPDVGEAGQDAFIHYMTVGWRERRDPSNEFSTKTYLLRYPDILEAGVNPFLHWIMHGQAEGRVGGSSAANFRKRLYQPSITAILVNDAAAPLTPDCIAAVLRQSYSDMRVLIVGAVLSDACRATLASGIQNRPGAVPEFLFDDGSTSPWALLQRAVEQTSGDLLWYVRGRAVHDFEFLARVTSSFADSSVQLGFGRRVEPGDTDYLIAEADLAHRMADWTRHATIPAAVWFPDQLRPDSLAVDQMSFVWRRREIHDEVWRSAGAYQHLDLWRLWLHMASGGQIANVGDAVMRVPPAPAGDISPSADAEFLGEVARLSAEVQSRWPVRFATADDALAIAGIKHHLLIVTHGIFAGGAENLPIQLANAIAERGIIVSMLIFKIDMNAEMRATLNPGVSIYEADWTIEYGLDRFVRDIGCTVIHSHGVIGEMFFFRVCEEPLPVPYVATLHGSYEASTTTELPESLIAKIVHEVDLFVYTADKNLAPLLRHDVRPEQLIKMKNAMPVDPVPFSRSRAELGIAEEAIVFTLVARGIAEKGWSTAINAFRSVQERNPHRPMHLCLVGEGDEPDRLEPLYAGIAPISFLGFQLRIQGLYRISDVAIVPTRFAGESFPLCIIQALQVGVPVIATDIGEIASMLEVDGVAGGIVVEASSDDDVFDARFAEAMHDLVDDQRRRRFASKAAILGQGYDMAALTDQYVSLYDDVSRRFAGGA